MSWDYRTTPAGALGHLGELEIRRQLEQIPEVCVSPLYTMADGSAPAMVSWLERTVLPDLQVHGRGKTWYVEIKTKVGPYLWGLANEMRTGFDLPLWAAYTKIQQRSGLQVVFAFLHLYEDNFGKRPGRHVLWAPLNDLATVMVPVRQPHRHAPWGMAVFPTSGPRNVFRRQEPSTVGDDLQRYVTAYLRARRQPPPLP